MLWGGRTKHPLHREALAFSSSLAVDVELFFEDIDVSIAHASMLGATGILTEQESRQIVDGLRQIADSYRDGTWNPLSESFEDVHSAIEAKLSELIGPVAGKLHTGRSRNDQIATDERLWVIRKSDGLRHHIRTLQQVLVRLASEHVDTVMPGYTHLQRAQPISLAFHLLAYVEMLDRDARRFAEVKRAADECPLGSGALAGSTLPLDRQRVAQMLGFSSSSRNALDAVSDRDFLLEFLHACSVGMMHLSRLAEDIILWSTTEWRFITLHDAWTTGSSLMPQKRNPDMVELIRGKAGRTYGNYLALATLLKALPMSYNRDLQEDKKPVFESERLYRDSLSILCPVVGTMTVNVNRFAAELHGDFSSATDLAEFLVTRGVAFREAHGQVSQLVKLAESKAFTLGEVSFEDVVKCCPNLSREDWTKFWYFSSVAMKKTQGSPNPPMVRDQIAQWQRALNDPMTSEKVSG